jgi:limonene-1,2-epoxide hydrolase
MISPVATVEAFLARLGEPAGFVTAVRDWFTPATVYENIGMTKTTGIEEAAAFAEQFVTGSARLPSAWKISPWRRSATLS